MDKKVLAVLLLVAAGLVAWYFFLQKKTTATTTVPLPTGLGADDDAALQKLLDYFKANTSDNGAALEWMLQDMVKRMDGTDPVDHSYTVNGKIPKAGAFMAVYASEYFNVNGDGMALINGVTADQFNQGIYAIFYTYQNAALQKALVSA